MLFRRHVRLGLVTVLGVLLAGVVAVVASGQTNGVQTLMTQLERPARPLGTAARGRPAVGRRDGLTIALFLASNRASAPTMAEVRVLDGAARPVSGARVTLTYSMPSMAMWRVYTRRLNPVAGQRGRYAALQGILGMPGRWRIDVTVTQSGRVPVHLAFSELLTS